MSYVVTSPLRVAMSSNRKKDYILNLNKYRNYHFKVNNRAKVIYKEGMREQILKLPRFDQIMIVVVWYPRDNRLGDTSNICSLHDKFFCDALVELGKLPEDDYRYIPDVIYRFGGVDKDNPRVEIEITPIKKQVGIWKFCNNSWSMVKPSARSKKPKTT